VERRITCPTCCASLSAREAQFELKYFLWRKAAGGWNRTPLSAWRTQVARKAATKQMAMPAAGAAHSLRHKGERLLEVTMTITLPLTSRLDAPTPQLRR